MIKYETPFFNSSGNQYANFDGSSGKVHIGSNHTSNPAATLDVRGDISSSGEIYSIGDSNPALDEESAMFNKFGVMGHRSNLYFTNQKTDGLIAFGVGGVHDADTDVSMVPATVASANASGLTDQQRTQQLQQQQQQQVQQQQTESAIAKLDPQ